MSLLPQDKVNMSLDEIIKISKTEKRKQNNQVKRGRFNSRGQGFQRGRGRGNQQNASQPSIKSNSNSSRHGSARGRGRGRGSFQSSLDINSLDRVATNQFSNQNKNQGLGRGGNTFKKQMIFTNSRRGSNFGNTQMHQNAIDPETKAALLREKQLALKNLKQAQQNFQNVNLALQKSSREALVNQKRGLNLPTRGRGGVAATRGRGGTTVNRGRGGTTVNRGRGGATINRDIGGASVNRGRGGVARGRLINQPVRQLNKTSVTVINPSAVDGDRPMRGKTRRWRGNLNRQRSDHLTVQVSNQSLHINEDQGSIIDQLKLLKPAVPTEYKFQKSMFATPATGVSLNDRFSNSASSLESYSEERKVFI